MPTSYEPCWNPSLGTWDVKQFHGLDSAGLRRQIRAKAECQRHYDRLQTYSLQLPSVGMPDSLTAEVDTNTSRQREIRHISVGPYRRATDEFRSQLCSVPNLVAPKHFQPICRNCEPVT
jgi:hypothetical protein